MDVSSQPVSLTTNIACSACGYLRTGIPPDALCPECGAPPPMLVAPLIANVGAAVDRSQQAWLATITLGLVVLFVCSFYAIESEFFVNNGGLTLVVINAPAPKLTAAACLLRQIGDPREWGVQGFMATLGTLLGIWLATEPHSSEPEPHWINLRRATRVVSVLTFGGLFGGLVSGYVISQFWSWSVLPALIAAVAGVEMPVILLFYLYLARFSRRFDPSPARRSQFGLVVAGSLGAAACGLGALLSFLRGGAEDKPVELWRLLQTTYGILSISAGAFMTLAFVRLTARTFVAALDASVISLPAALSGLIGGIGGWFSRVRSDPTRYAAALALILWMHGTRPVIATSAWSGHSGGLGGDLIAFNFIGPKFIALPLIDVNPYSRLDARADVLAMLAAVWLLTSFRATSATGAGRLPPAMVVRWLPTIAVGVMLGFLLTIERVFDSVVQSNWYTGGVLMIEAVATLLLYLFVANIAATIEESALARRLRWMAWIAFVIICGPLVLLYASHLRLPGHRHAAFVCIGMTYGLAVIVSGITAWALIVRVTWALLAGRRSTEGPPHAVAPFAVAR